MNIEVSKPTQQVIEQALLSGRFSTAEAFLEAAAQAFAARESRVSDEEDRTAFERFNDLGAIGCCEGPTDLSTNPKHMDGFGR